jgi:Pyridoxamine 5'-phosphate oxidase
MSKSRLNDTFIKFIKAQHMFFVASATADGFVNVSPKGLDSLQILSNTRMIWLNLSGSGNETATHIQESSRITLMFCAFEGTALIVRVYGKAKVIHPRDKEWEELIGFFPKMAGSRQLFDIEIIGVQASCGSGVPFYEFKGQRGETELLPFYEAMGEAGVKNYWERKNLVSLDGKPTGIFESK